MPSATPPSNPNAVIGTLSAARMSTYSAAYGGDNARALALYAWNARIAAALLVPTNFAEVAVRNAVDEVLTATYGLRWPWNPTFERSLPAPGSGYNPRRDLVATRNRHSTTGKVIADLKFVFWQKMFTARHDQRLWTPSIHSLLPNAPSPVSATQLRQRIYDDLESVRQLRNRIAHHEPIFSRNLHVDLARVHDLVHLRCADSSQWLRTIEDATAVLGQRP